MDPDPYPGPGPCFFRHWPSRCQQKTNLKKSFSAYYFLKVHLQHFSNIKSQKESQNSRNQGFSYYFCMMIEGSGSGSIPLTNGSGPGGPKKYGSDGSGSATLKTRWLTSTDIQQAVPSAGMAGKMTNLTESSLTVWSGVSDLLPAQYSRALMFFTLGFSFLTFGDKNKRAV